MTEDPLLGRQLANFAVERLLGRGGMARVYYGQDVKLERPVAIKVIDLQYRDDPDYAERFVREARAVAAWRHENIVQVYYADDQEGLYYFVMEYIDGMDVGRLLAQYVDAGELMPHEDVLVIGRAVASALDYAHQQGVIHRDVKPSNVMVSKDDRVILTDFGLALDVHRGSQGHVFGSAYYVAPEQARRSAAAVPQSDLYSLGVILYQMLTGEVPFDDLSTTSLALKHLTTPPPRPREINPELDEETEAVLLKALNKSPEDRYQTGGELMDALGRALSADRAEPAPQPDASLLGLQLDEYRLEALLGQGGMARVYRGVDVNLDRRVAIKVIDTPFRTDSDYVARFKREAQAIARLEHPHIVRLYRYGEAEGLLYMAMQYVEGSDLDSVLADYRQDRAFIEPEQASRIVREVCLALDYAHSQGVIHRDVKPANIILDKQGNAILADFGLALLTEFGTRGEIFGSPRYIAPEQAISSANVVPQSDLYAVGVILYEMFVGQPPFDAEDPLDLALLQMSEPPCPPRELCPEISPELEEVILKTLAKEPEGRYQSGAELADALDRALGLTTAQAPSSPGETILRPPALESVEAKPEERALPPIPAAVAALEPTQTTKETILSPPAAPLSTAPPPATAPAPSAAPLTRKRVIVFAGAIVIVCMLAALLAAAAFLLTSGNDQGLLGRFRTTKTSTPADIAGATATATVDATSFQGPSATASVTVVATPSPPSAAQDTPTSAAMPADTATPTGTSSPAETPTPTVVPTETSTPTPTETPTPEPPTSYDLLIAKRDDNGLFVINHTTAAFPLATLRLGDSKGEASGVDWGVGMLEQDACVTVWKEKGEPELPKGLTCNQVGEPMTRPDRERFWEETFYVYYDGKRIGVCEKRQGECPVRILAQESYNLRIVKRDRDGLFVVNQAVKAFPLAPLHMGNDKGAVDGAEWDTDMLEQDACVAVWKERGEPRLPKGLACTQAGEHLTRPAKERFWEETFDVYYDGEQVGTCEEQRKECFVSIPIKF